MSASNPFTKINFSNAITGTRMVYPILITLWAIIFSLQAQQL